MLNQERFHYKNASWTIPFTAKEGFSLIEILVSLALTILLLGGLLFISTALLADWTHTRERVHLDGRGNQILRALERDFSAWIRPPTSNSNSDIITNYIRPEGSAENWPASTQFILLTTPQDRPRTAPDGGAAAPPGSAVAYALALQNQNNPSIQDIQTTALYRTVVDSKTVFLQQINNLDSNFIAEIFNGNYSRHDIEFLLSTGVVYLHLTFIIEYVNIDNEKRLHRIPPSQPFLIQGGRILDLDKNNFGPDGLSSNGRFTGIEIHLGVLSDRGVNWMQSNNWNPAFLDAAMKRHGKEFFHRITF